MKNIYTKIGLAIMFFLAGFSLTAQQKQYLTTKDSDKEAIQLFNKSKAILKNALTIDIQYTMTLQYPDAEPQMINGKAKQKGKMYFIDSGDHNIYCDGEKLVVWHRTQNIAQINDIDESEGIMTPEGLLRAYDEKKYIFMLAESLNRKGNRFQKIILKPESRRSEYTKIEVFIDEKTSLPDEIKLFMKDGSRSFLKINAIQLNQKMKNNVFIFDPAAHSGVSVEDLRID
jgi:outer membrane lipoprotein-sorting protein